MLIINWDASILLLLLLKVKIRKDNYEIVNSLQRVRVSIQYPITFTLSLGLKTIEMLIFFLQGNSCKNRIGYDRYCEIRKDRGYCTSRTKRSKMWRLCKKTCFRCSRSNYKKAKISRSIKIFFQICNSWLMLFQHFSFKVLQGLAKTEEVMDIAKEGNVQDGVQCDPKDLKWLNIVRKCAINAKNCLLN